MSTGAVVENLSNRKLACILGILLIAQICFVLLGSSVSPPPSNWDEFLMTTCRDTKLGTSGKWFYIRPPGKGCEIMYPDNDGYHTLKTGDAREIVFTAQMPHARDGMQLRYSPWFQSLLGLLMVEIRYHHEFAAQLGESPTLLLEVRLGYKDTLDQREPWKELVQSRVIRQLSCTIDAEHKIDGLVYDCEPLQLFELPSEHPLYLVNIRMPDCNVSSSMTPNCNVGHVTEFRIIEIHQNGGFTQVWLGIKTLLCPAVCAAVYWYWRRVRLLARPALLVEKAVLVLGVAMAVLDLPVEWLSLYFRMPFLTLMSDIRQGLFYLTLFSFWLVFTGEHLIDDTAKNSLGNYWRYLSFAMFASACMLVFDMCERGIHLTDPFYSIWSTKQGTNIAYTFVILGAVSAGVYFIFLASKIAQAVGTIKRRRAALAHMNRNRRLKYENIIYRFRFLMLLTLACAALTVAGFMLDQIGAGQLRWGEYDESPELANTTAAFLTGTLGLWNLYVLLLLAMYAPSHKEYRGAERVPEPGEDDDMLTDSLVAGTSTEAVTESSAMATFVKPTSE